MSVEAGLLHAILGTPDDDLPRLAFADRLEELGDPRAAFIRAECASARLPAGDTRRAEFLELRDRLLSEHAPQWCAELGLTPSACAFSRGFVESVEVTAAWFLEHAERLLQSAPVRGVHFLHAAGRVGDLAACPWLRRLTTLDLTANAAVRDPEVILLAASPHLGNLTTLDLSSASIDQEGVESLANAEGLRGLCRLRFAGSGIRRAGLEAVLRSSKLRGVTTLDVSGNHQCWVNPTAGEPYMARTEVNVGNEGVLLLAESPESARLEVIDLALNEIEESGWEALLASPYLSGVRSLNVFESDHVYLDEGPPGDDAAPYTINEEICDALCVAMPGAARRRIARTPGDPRFTAPPCTIDEGVRGRLLARFGSRVTFAPPARRFGACISSPLPDGSRTDWFGYCAPLDPAEA